MERAIYLVEFQSISQGVGVLDQMLKRADLTVIHANPICIGKYLIVVGGDVADVREAQQAAENPDEGAPISSYLLTRAHQFIFEYFDKKLPPITQPPDALGVFETRNVSHGFESLDKALKGAQVEILRIWLGPFLGGKLCYVLGGSTSEIESAIKSATRAVPEKEKVGSRVITGPDSTTLNLFLKGK